MTDSLEGLWVFQVENQGSGVLVLETDRIFGGDNGFYWTGRYDYNPFRQELTATALVTNHNPDHLGTVWGASVSPGGSFVVNILLGRRAAPDALIGEISLDGTTLRLQGMARKVADLP